MPDCFRLLMRYAMGDIAENRSTIKIDPTSVTRSFAKFLQGAQRWRTFDFSSCSKRYACKGDSTGGYVMQPSSQRF